MQESPREGYLRRVGLRRAALQRDLAGLYPGPVRLVLEIGSGHGHWLVDYATRFPSSQCLGIDIVGERVERARRKAARAGTANAAFLQAEAMDTLELLPGHAAIDEVVVLFPDPWPKKRHWKNRLVSPPFLDRLGGRCEAGARLRVRTDDDGYFAWIMEAVESHSAWRTTSDASWPFERETVFQSRARAFQSATFVRT